MSKDIYTSRNDLVCGKIDRAEELALKLESVELIDLLKAIRYDCERMESGLARHKTAFTKKIRELGVEQDDVYSLMVFCVKNHDYIPDDLKLSEDRRKRLIEFRDDYYHGNDYTDYRLRQSITSGNDRRTEMFLNSKNKENVCDCKECGRKYYKTT
jgi:hypothetical protein